MSGGIVNGSGVASKDTPNGWQVNVGNLGSSVQLRKARLTFVKSEPEEAQAVASGADPAPNPAPPAFPKAPVAPSGPGLLKAAALANAGLGVLSLVSSLAASAGPTASAALVALLFGATAAMFANAGLLFVWARKN
jgi:hypothetical protein